MLIRYAYHLADKLLNTNQLSRIIASYPGRYATSFLFRTTTSTTITAIKTLSRATLLAKLPSNLFLKEHWQSESGLMQLVSLLSSPQQVPTLLWNMVQFHKDTTMVVRRTASQSKVSPKKLGILTENDTSSRRHFQETSHLSALGRSMRPEIVCSGMIFLCSQLKRG